jgi:hypothetical protein
MEDEKGAETGEVRRMQSAKCRFDKLKALSQPKGKMKNAK